MIDQKEKEAMDRLRAAMNGFNGEAFLANDMARAPAPMHDPMSPAPMYEGATGDLPYSAPAIPMGMMDDTSYVAPPAPVSSPEGAAMRGILSRFYAATADEQVPISNNVVERLVDDAKHMPAFREALVTEETATGVRIGGWNIIVNEEKRQKSYDVAQLGTGVVIASNLRLYEAARALANSLNEGGTVNSAEVKSILAEEEEYSRNLEDAITFRHNGERAKKAGDTKRVSIMEARYDAAKLRALQAKSNIEKLL